MTDVDVAPGPQTFADVEAILADELPGYEARPGQQQLAAAVEDLLASAEPGATPTHLLAQAGCGVGKSLAYLIPAILSGKQIAVSVTTKALQDQLSGKDMPFLEAHLPEPFTWAVLKGRSNYLCLRCATSVQDTSRIPHLGQIIEWVRAHETEFDGTRDGLPFEIEDREWYAIASEADGCKAANCKDDAGLGGWRCFCTRARKQAANAQVVITNHALLSVDLGIGGGLLGTRDVVALDEAHEFEKIVADAIGYRLTHRTFTSLVADLRGFAHNHSSEDFETEFVDVLGAADELFRSLDEIPALKGGNTRTLRLTTPELEKSIEFYAEVIATLTDLNASWRRAYFATDGIPGASLRKLVLTSRITNLLQRTSALIEAPQKETVRWIEIEDTKRGDKIKTLRAAPISVAKWLNEKLWSQVPTILVSATLRVQGKFDFFITRLGIPAAAAHTLVVQSPFDFKRQGLLYIPLSAKNSPEGLPVPKGADVPVFEAAANQEIIRLIEISKGRALGLFTSNRHLRSAVNAWRGRRAKKLPYTLLAQGEATNKVLAQRFKEDVPSVLFGSKSFFTGVDFQGETLSLLAIARMPFDPPGEPLTEARCEALGNNAFAEYTLPNMSVLIQQAVGRLIRHTNDRGVVAVLDPNFADTGYGRKVIADLPGYRITRDIADVEAFFAETA